MNQSTKSVQPDGLTRRLLSGMSTLAEVVQAIVSKQFGRQRETKNPRFQEAKMVKDKVEEECSSHPAPVSLIDMLPAELLADIFQAYVGLSYSPWNLARVCTRWRDVALRTAVLWSHITIFDYQQAIRRLTSYSVPGISGRFITIGRSQVCITPEQVDGAVSRAGSVSLKVIIIITMPKKTEDIPSSTNSLNLLLKVFGMNGIHPRIYSLKVAGLPFINPSHLPFPQPLVASIPLLEEFSCSSSRLEWAPFIGQILSSSQKLDDMAMSISMLNALKDFHIWDNIEHLNVEEHALMDTYTCQLAVNAVLPKCHRLRRLLVGLSIVWPNGGSEPASFEHLQFVRLYCEPKHLRRLRAPLLTSMQLCEWPRPNEINSSVFTSVDCSGFPALKKLTLRSNDPRWVYRSKLTQLVSLSIDTPVLRGAEGGSWGGIPSKEIFLPDILLLVEEAVFETFSGESAFITALESVPNARKVTIVPGFFLSPTFGQELIPRLFAPEPLTLCPKAEYIQIGRYTLAIETPKDIIEDLVRELINIRQQRGAPLKSFVIHWGRPHLKREYVE